VRLEEKPSVRQDQGQTTVKQTQFSTMMVACPGSFLGRYHDCPYNTQRGIWKCPACGLAGNGDGYALLTRLESELHGLATELEIRDFKAGMGGRW